MSSRNPIQGPTYLDPLFPIPEGLSDYQYKSAPDGASTEFLIEGNGLEYDETELQNDVDLVDDIDSEIIPELDVPDQVTVVAQNIKTLPSGLQVIDLVLEVEDIPGAVNYDFRIVKM